MRAHLIRKIFPTHYFIRGPFHKKNSPKNIRSQFAALERRTLSTGREHVDPGPGQFVQLPKNHVISRTRHGSEMAAPVEFREVILEGLSDRAQARGLKHWRDAAEGAGRSLITRKVMIQVLSHSVGGGVFHPGDRRMSSSIGR
jgi:hypothetical protein